MFISCQTVGRSYFRKWKFYSRRTAISIPCITFPCFFVSHRRGVNANSSVNVCRPDVPLPFCFKEARRRECTFCLFRQWFKRKLNYPMGFVPRGKKQSSSCTVAKRFIKVQYMASGANWCVNLFSSCRRFNGVKGGNFRAIFRLCEGGQAASGTSTWKRPTYAPHIFTDRGVGSSSEWSHIPYSSCTFGTSALT